MTLICGSGAYGATGCHGRATKLQGHAVIRMAFDSDRRDTGLRTRSLATENARPRAS